MDIFFDTTNFFYVPDDHADDETESNIALETSLELGGTFSIECAFSTEEPPSTDNLLPPPSK